MMMGHSPELGWLGWLVKNTSTSNSHHNKASVQVGSRHKTCGASFKPQQPPEVSNALISFSGMRKLTSLDVKQIIPGHKVAKWQSQHLNLDCLTPEPLLFTTPNTAFQEDFASLTDW